MRFRSAIFALFAGLLTSTAQAQEVYGGVYAHEVETPLTFAVEESGVDLQFGYRFEREEALDFIGSPQPYLIASLNSEGDTSFAGGGLSWQVPLGRAAYVRPGLGLVVHDGPSLRVSEVTGKRTDLGSRVLFEPEIAIGARLSDRLSLEASWVHISHARLFNAQQNPGIDMMGLRLSYAVR
ncbi:acyloxyacyl hydrolase [Alteriqipengyuania sp. WL0013]|uniref:acyloxyacyl hydrolase n=1 Tax=Alteriqipengyuania sp. WL0013 TaxID=3110773 RepID=UPI002C314A56|nr:acyloxyacyl hydrolase [Alteriqipengyuania sp. WL0013]MEB3416537.1 acyloxyacyl hydrolase [Alteriqipengyuania sp. WL0013]